MDSAIADEQKNASDAKSSMSYHYVGSYAVHISHCRPEAIIIKLIFPTVLPILSGETLVLRAIEDGDAAALLVLYGDPFVMKYTDEPPFADLETVAVMLASVRRLFASGDSLEWAVALHDGYLIGTCGLHSFDLAEGTAEVGCLLNPAYWGHGQMAEAIGLLTCFARDVLRLQRLTADVALDNVRARLFFSKLGYTVGASGMLELALG